MKSPTTVAGSNPNAVVSIRYQDGGFVCRYDSKQFATEDTLLKALATASVRAIDEGRPIMIFPSALTGEED
jgi:hypothetical protein